MTLSRLLRGHWETIAGTVYGTIVVLAMLTAGAAAYEDDLWRLVVIAGASVIVLWAAHVYAHALGESVRARHRVTATEIWDIARREAAIPLAAVFPLSAVTLGALGLMSARFSLWLALGLGVATLAIQAVRYAYLEQLSRTGTVLAVALNLAFGFAFVALKALLAH
jgi:hypothetical protein